MGQFSWLDCCNTSRQILDGVHENVYLLIPKEFGGGHILETDYDGYGRFGGHDVYDLVADWNKDMIPYIIHLIEKGKWHCSTTKDDITVMRCFYAGEQIPDHIQSWKKEKRNIGITIACYDEDNARLEYPIKITHDPNAVYEQCDPSLVDPDQGWKRNDDDEWW